MLVLLLTVEIEDRPKFGFWQPSGAKSRVPTFPSYRPKSLTFIAQRSVDLWRALADTVKTWGSELSGCR